MAVRRGNVREMRNTVTVRPAAASDAAWIAHVLADSWGDVVVVAHGTAYQALDLPALIAERDGAQVGLLTYTLTGDGLEVVSLDATVPRAGVGTALLAAAVDLGRERGAGRLWLVTTNDNLDALRFYQRRGLRISAVAPGAVDAARALKPGIPLIGDHGIPIRDELTLEIAL